MDSRVFVVVTGPDGFPQWMETEDRIFMIPLLFTPHLTQNRGQRFPVLTVSAFLPSLFCLSFLISAFLTISLCYSNPGGLMI